MNKTHRKITKNSAYGQLGSQTRYILWYLKKNFGKEIIGCVPTVFVEASHALNFGEEQRERGEWIDYNYSVVNNPVLMGSNAHDKSA